MPKSVFILLFLSLFLSCKGSAKDHIIYAENQIKPVIYTQNGKMLTRELTLITQLFKQQTGFEPQVINNINTGEKSIIALELVEKIDDKQNSGFSFRHNHNTLVISAVSAKELNYAIRYFFATYAKKTKDSQSLIKKITIPENLNYVNIPDFEYREPYFPLNQKEGFRLEYTTDNLEETWGLWGHNIRKVIALTPDMLAEIDGEKLAEQLCFSSVELEKAVTLYIQNKSSDNPELTRYMIMPDDNSIVCLCEQCQTLGNTRSSASPAVFFLLNKIAAKFPKQEFFTTGYITTKQPPKQLKLASNIGVMLSTMDFPKGVVLENSKKFPLVQQTLDDWKKLTDKIYLWDYAINFDSYFESYPTLSIAQKNLQYYKKQNIKGVFMQGNEDSYAAFQDLKCQLYAQLLRDTDLNLKAEIKAFFDKKYPTLAGLLFAYYAKIESNALLSNRELDIYGGIAQAKKKYLNHREFSVFYDNLLTKLTALPEQEANEFQKLLLALTFQKLEMARTSGIGEEGYAEFEKDNPIAITKKDIIQAVERLEKLSKKTKIDVYSELGFSLQNYINLYKTELLNKEYQNLLFGKRLKALTELDEDYADTRTLTDGTIGFNDYFNNWMLVTVAEDLRLSIEAEGLHETKLVEMSFLNNPKHNIYLPAEVEVNIDGRLYKTAVELENSVATSRYILRIPVQLTASDKSIDIKITKQPELKSKSIACDEVVFK